MNPYQTILTHHKIPMNFIIRPLSTIFNHIKPPLIHINSKEVHHESASESLTTLSLLRREALGGGRSATLGPLVWPPWPKSWSRKPFLVDFWWNSNGISGEKTTWINPLSWDDFWIMDGLLMENPIQMDDWGYQENRTPPKNLSSSQWIILIFSEFGCNSKH